MRSVLKQPWFYGILLGIAASALYVARWNSSGQLIFGAILLGAAILVARVKRREPGQFGARGILLLAGLCAFWCIQFPLYSHLLYRIVETYQPEEHETYLWYAHIISIAVWIFMAVSYWKCRLAIPLWIHLGVFAAGFIFRLFFPIRLNHQIDMALTGEEVVWLLSGAASFATSFGFPFSMALLASRAFLARRLPCREEPLQPSPSGENPVIEPGATALSWSWTARLSRPNIIRFLLVAVLALALYHINFHGQTLWHDKPLNAQEVASMIDFSKGSLPWTRFIGWPIGRSRDLLSILDIPLAALILVATNTTLGIWFSLPRGSVWKNIFRTKAFFLAAFVVFGLYAVDHVFTQWLTIGIESLPDSPIYTALGIYPWYDQVPVWFGVFCTLFAIVTITLRKKSPCTPSEQQP